MEVDPIQQLTVICSTTTAFESQVDFIDLSSKDLMPDYLDIGDYIAELLMKIKLKFASANQANKVTILDQVRFAQMGFEKIVAKTLKHLEENPPNDHGVKRQEGGQFIKQVNISFLASQSFERCNEEFEDFYQSIGFVFDKKNHSIPNDNLSDDVILDTDISFLEWTKYAVDLAELTIALYYAGCFRRRDGVELTIKDLVNYIGKIFNTNISNYSSLINDRIGTERYMNVKKHIELGIVRYKKSEKPPLEELED